MDDLLATFRVSAAGMRAQGTRLRVIGENLANASSAAQEPGATPYRRKVVSFRNELDRTTGLNMVRIDRVTEDMSPFEKKREPGHPAADADGYVLMPNVEPLIEMMDMREAQRSYVANLNMIRTSKNMVRDTIDILR